MTDYQIYKKLRPFIMKRVCYAILGLVFILLMVWLCSYWGEMFPEYRREIIIVVVGVGIIVGWKIIRAGAKKYSMAQVAMVTELLTGDDRSNVDRKEAFKRVNNTFKYASVFNLIKNIYRHKNFRKVGQFVTVMTANLIPYVGHCSMAWIFAHPEEEKIKGACHAITNYIDNRKKLSLKLFLCFMKEVVFVVITFFIIMTIEICIYLIVVNNIKDLDVILDKYGSFTETLGVAWEVFMDEGHGYHWDAANVLVAVALYISWFIRIFSIRAYQMIGIVREFLTLGKNNPPSDDLYNRLMEEWEKKNDRRKNKETTQMDKPES